MERHGQHAADVFASPLLRQTTADFFPKFDADSPHSTVFEFVYESLERPILHEVKWNNEIVNDPSGLKLPQCSHEEIITSGHPLETSPAGVAEIKSSGLQQTTADEATAREENVKKCMARERYA